MKKITFIIISTFALVLFAEIINAQTLPSAVYKTNEASEDLFDYARAGNYHKVKIKVDELNNLYKNYIKDARQNKLNSQLLDFYSLYLEKINDELKSKEYYKIAFAANQITGIGSAFDNNFKTKIPGEIARLDYLGRELLLESNNRNVKAINRRIEDIDYTWSSIKDLVLKKHGEKQSAVFEKLIPGIKVNKTKPKSAAFVKSVNKYLDQIDRLESLF